MDFLSIIIFIGIAFLVSSKNKARQQGQQKNRQRPNTMNRRTMEETMNKPAESSVQRPQQKSRTFGSSSLEEMFREMQSDIRGVFGDLKNSNTPKPPVRVEPVAEEREAEEQEETNSWDSDYASYERSSYEDNEKVESKDKGRKAKVKKEDEDPPEAYENGRVSLNLSKHALVQAIVMSEILDKPKALRR